MRPLKKTFKKPFDFAKLSPARRNALQRGLTKHSMMLAGPAFVRALNSTIHPFHRKKRR